MKTAATSFTAFLHRQVGALVFLAVLAALTFGCRSPRVRPQWRPGQWQGPASPAPKQQGTRGPAPAPPELMRPDDLYTGQQMPLDIALFNGWLFWIDGGRNTPGSRILRAPAAGGAATVLASSLATPLDLAFDSERVYFVTVGNSKHLRANSSVCAVPIAGGPVTVLATPSEHPSSLALGGEFVYFSTWGGRQGGTISRVPRGGGAVQVIASGQDDPNHVEVDGDAIFWLEAGLWESGSVFHEHRTSGEPVLVMSIPPSKVEAVSYPLSRFTPRNHDVLFSSRGKLVSVARGSSGSLSPRTLDNIRLFAAGRDEIFAIKMSGLLVKFDESTGAETPLAQVPFPGGMAVDDSFIYVTDIEGGRILRIPKVNVGMAPRR